MSDILADYFVMFKQVEFKLELHPPTKFLVLFQDLIPMSEGFANYHFYISGEVESDMVYRLEAYLGSAKHFRCKKNESSISKKDFNRMLSFFEPPTLDFLCDCLEDMR